jgi:hypothetical protein
MVPGKIFDSGGKNTIQKQIPGQGTEPKGIRTVEACKGNTLGASKDVEDIPQVV